LPLPVNRPFFRSYSGNNGSRQRLFDPAIMAAGNMQLQGPAIWAAGNIRRPAMLPADLQVLAILQARRPAIFARGNRQYV